MVHRTSTPIHNNDAERDPRHLALGRNNWMIFGSPRGGKVACRLYSLVLSCKESGVDPQAYLEDVLRRIGTTPIQNLATLTPWGWKAARAKIHANASKHKAMSYGRMKTEEAKLRREIRKITEMAKGLDAAEDREFGPDFRGDELPAELQRRQERRAKIREAMKALEAEQAQEDAAAKRGAKHEASGCGPGLKRPNGTPPDTKQRNFTDPESRIMLTGRKSFGQCFNAQAAVDAEEQIIVAVDVSPSASDAEKLITMTDAVKRNCKQKPARVLADAGYKSVANFLALETRKIDACVALGRGENLPEKVSADKPATRRMACKLRSKRGRAQYKRRKVIVEPVFGWAKQVLGFRSFLMRGLRKARGEWNLVCLALNLRRMSTKLVWE